MNIKAKIYLASLYIIFPIVLFKTFSNLSSLNFNYDILFFIIVLFILMNFNTIYYKSKILTVIFLPALIPAIVLFEPFWVILIGFFGSIKITEIKKGNFIWYKFLFNRLMIGLSAGFAAYIFNFFYIRYYSFNIFISILLASFTYFLVNNVLLFFIMKFTGEGRELSYLIFISEILRNVFISFFLGIILYFSYINFGKLFFVLIIMLIYVVRDFFFSRFQLLNSFTQIIESFLKVIDSKDHYTEGHCERVANYTKKLCDTIKVNQRKKEKIVNMAKIHDIGKIYVDDQILKSDDILDEEDFKEMKKHSYYGYELLKDIDMLNDDLEIILHHHEFYNGSGYPDGIQGEEIPLGARILNICDSFDVMTTGRSYKKALNKKETIEELKYCSKKQFDPELVDVMVDLIEEGTFDSSFE